MNHSHYTSQNKLHRQSAEYFELIVVYMRRHQCIYFISNRF